MTTAYTDELLAKVEAHRVDHEWPDWHLVDLLIDDLKLWRERADDAVNEVERLERKLADVTYACNDNWAKWKRAEADLARERAVHTQVPPGPGSTFRPMQTWERRL
jgi:hypothetical protein